MLKKKYERVPYFADGKYRAEKTPMGDFWLIDISGKQHKQFGYYPDLKACNKKIKELRKK